MPLYQYRAAHDDGRIAKGRIDALHETDLETQLKNTGLILLSAKTIASTRTVVKRMPRREVLGILFQMEMLIRAGVPILDCLADLRDSSDTPAGRSLAANMFEKVEAGATLGEAVGSFPSVFSPTVVNLIQSGEVAGQLPEVLKEVVTSLKWQDEMVAKLKKLMIYPVIMIVVLTVMVTLLMVFLVPELTKFLSNLGKELPLQTRILIGLSDLFVHYWWILLPTPAGVFIFVFWLSEKSNRVRFKLHSWQLAIPRVGLLIKQITLARFVNTLGLTYRTGIPLIDGLALSENVTTNMVFQGAIRRARDRVANGSSLSDSFAAEQVFPALVIRMLRVGETTGALDDALANVSYFYSRDIDETMDKVQAMIGPVFVVVIALVLLFIIFAIFAPLYSTFDKIT